MNATVESGVRLREGGCHCGAIKFRVRLAEPLKALSCNCSVCTKSSYIHLIVASSDFELLSSRDQLSCYQFNTHQAEHLFCKRCGVKSFYIPRSHPDGVSVNARCVDELSLADLTIEPFDGRNWEAAIGTIT